MRLYDFFHAIADVFWKKYVDSIKKRAKQDHGSKKIIEEKSSTNKQGSVRKSKGRNKKKV
jgi:hypothetical protein